MHRCRRLRSTWCRCFHLMKNLGASSCSLSNRQKSMHDTLHQRFASIRLLPAIHLCGTTSLLLQCRTAPWATVRHSKQVEQQQQSRPSPRLAQRCSILHAVQLGVSKVVTKHKQGLLTEWSLPSEALPMRSATRTWKMWSRISSLETSSPCRPASTAAYIQYLHYEAPCQNQIYIMALASFKCSPFQ